MSDEPASANQNEDPIICRVTWWYYKRMGLMAAACVLFGLYFLYDWKIGYPKANAIAERQDHFEKVILPSYDEAQKARKLDEWMAEAEANGWPKGKEGEPPKWIQYAAANGWPEKPKRFTEKEVDEQLWWGLGTITAGLAIAVVLLLNRNKTLVCHADHWVTPEGKTVRFADVMRVDKRKWDLKGLAYAWHRPEGGGAERREVIDDLKFSGADRLLTRLLAAFKGELIEKVADDDGEEEQNGAEADAKP